MENDKSVDELIERLFNKIDELFPDFSSSFKVLTPPSNVASSTSSNGN